MNLRLPKNSLRQATRQRVDDPKKGLKWCGRTGIPLLAEAEILESVHGGLDGEGMVALLWERGICV